MTTRFVPREKMSKKARQALDRKKRACFTLCPALKIEESGKRYDRQRIKRDLRQQDRVFLCPAHARPVSKTAQRVAAPFWLSVGYRLCSVPPADGLSRCRRLATWSWMVCIRWSRVAMSRAVASKELLMPSGTSEGFL